MQGNDIDESLKTVDSLRHAEGLELARDGLVVLVADDDYDSVSFVNVKAGGSLLGRPFRAVT